MKTRDMILIGLFAAIICICAPFSIPIGAVPLSLSTFAIYLAAIVLGAKKGTYAVIIYILLGIIGLPVFSGFQGGIGKVLGVTGGYIIGYIPCVFIAGAVIEKYADKKVAYVAALILGTLVLFVFGTIWFMVQSGNSLAYSLSACVLPFIPGDAIKIAVAVVVGYKLRAYAFKDIKAC